MISTLIYKLLKVELTVVNTVLRVLGYVESLRPVVTMPNNLFDHMIIIAWFNIFYIS